MTTLSTASLTSPQPTEDGLSPSVEATKSDSWTTTDFNSTTTTPDSRPLSARGTSHSSPILPVTQPAGLRGGFVLGDDSLPRSYDSSPPASSRASSTNISSDDLTRAPTTTTADPERTVRFGKHPTVANPDHSDALRDAAPSTTASTKYRRTHNRRRKTIVSRKVSRGSTGTNGDHDHTADTKPVSQPGEVKAHPTRTETTQGPTSMASQPPSSAVTVTSDSPPSQHPLKRTSRPQQSRRESSTEAVAASWSSVASLHRPPLLAKMVTPSLAKDTALGSHTNNITPASVTCQTVHSFTAHGDPQTRTDMDKSAGVVQSSLTGNPTSLRSSLARQPSTTARSMSKSVHFSPDTIGAGAANDPTQIRSVQPRSISPPLPVAAGLGSNTHRVSSTPAPRPPSGTSRGPRTVPTSPTASRAHSFYDSNVSQHPRVRAHSSKQAVERVLYLAHSPHSIWHPENQQRMDHAILDSELEISEVTRFLNPLLASCLRLQPRLVGSPAYTPVNMGYNGVRMSATVLPAVYNLNPARTVDHTSGPASAKGGAPKYPSLANALQSPPLAEGRVELDFDGGDLYSSLACLRGSGVQGHQPSGVSGRAARVLGADSSGGQSTPAGSPYHARPAGRFKRAPAARLMKSLPLTFQVPLGNHACLAMQSSGLCDIRDDIILQLCANNRAFWYQLEKALVFAPLTDSGNALPAPLLALVDELQQGLSANAGQAHPYTDSSQARSVSRPSSPRNSVLRPPPLSGVTGLDCPTIIPSYLASHTVTWSRLHYFYQDTHASHVTVSSTVARQGCYAGIGGTHEMVPPPTTLPSHQVAAINPWGNMEILHSASPEVLILPQPWEHQAFWRMEGNSTEFQLNLVKALGNASYGTGSPSKRGSHHHLHPPYAIRSSSNITSVAGYARWWDQHHHGRRSSSSHVAYQTKGSVSNTATGTTPEGGINPVAHIQGVPVGSIGHRTGSGALGPPSSSEPDLSHPSVAEEGLSKQLDKLKREAFLNSLPNPLNNQGVPQHCLVAFYTHNTPPLYPKYGIDPSLRSRHPQFKTRRLQRVRDQLRESLRDQRETSGEYSKVMALSAGLGHHPTTMV
ncbi:hypothetical protein IWQ62_002061 [Dispira parvispora]|uniref:Uncharacterized protein n=1 Tax=Dispira parvispora TaxID=1520584 RepID=A0A9W8E488_9FUNG|nr:hypothetical protein IWQ62_002061 [Dispira parvispora]